MNQDETRRHEEQTVLIAKVERLWRKARSSQYPEEAKAYQEKALYLMARARITEAMLDLDATGDEIIDVAVGQPLKGGYNAPAEALFAVVSRAYSCRPYFALLGRQSQPFAVGFASDIARVKFIYPVLLADAFRSSAQLRGRNAGQTKAMRRSALFGYGEAIAMRFERINRIAAGDAAKGSDQSGSDVPLDAANAASQSSTALVFKSREAQVDSVFADKDLTARRGMISGGYGGRDHGYEAGMQADLTAGSRSVAGAQQQLSA